MRICKQSKAPAALPAAIREVKAALRARIAASGRSVDEVFAVVERRVQAAVDQIVATRARREQVWPIVEYRAGVADRRVRRHRVRRRLRRAGGPAVPWPNRFRPEDLNDIGRRGLGLL